MFRIAAKQLQVGNSAIVDSPLSRKTLYEEAQRIAQKVYDSSGRCDQMLARCHAALLTTHSLLPQYRTEIAIVECVAFQEDIWQARLQARNMSDADDKSHKPCSWNAVQDLVNGYRSIAS